MGLTPNIGRLVNCKKTLIYQIMIMIFRVNYQSKISWSRLNSESFSQLFVELFNGCIICSSNALNRTITMCWSSPRDLYKQCMTENIYSGNFPKIQTRKRTMLLEDLQGESNVTQKNPFRLSFFHIDISSPPLPSKQRIGFKRTPYCCWQDKQRRG